MTWWRGWDLSDVAATSHGGLESCPVCGGGRFAMGDAVVDDLLSAAWRLDAAEKELIERQQAYHCSCCHSNLRSMTLAGALMAHFSYEGVFEDFVRDCVEFRRLRVLEINEAGSLHRWLCALPGHRLATYPDTDMRTMEFSDASWDVIVHSDTLEHVCEPMAGLRECYRVLRPGGVMAMTVPMLPGRLTREADPLNPGFHGLDGERRDDYRVWSEFGADVWVMLMDAGFSSVTVSRLLESGTAAWLASRRGVAPLPYDGERLTTQFGGSRRIAIEHLHRYAFSVQLCGGKDVLDVACGEGYGSAMLSGVARSVIGLDRDAGSIGYAAAKYSATNLDFAVGAAEAIPLESGVMDCIVSFETLEHLECQEEFIRELVRVLRPGGILVVSTPNREIYTGQGGVRNPFHVRELDQGEFLELLGGHFRHVALIGQRSMMGSVLAVDGDFPNCVGEFRVGYGNGEFRPGVDGFSFFIAVCSDIPLPTLPAGVCLPEGEVHGDWMRAFELLPSPRLVLEHADGAHAFAPRPALVARLSEMEARLDAAKGRVEKLRGKLERERAKSLEMKRRVEERHGFRALCKRVARWFTKP